MEKNSMDKYASFQWIRDIRSEMAHDMEGMTPEERSAYINNRYEEARKGRPQYTLEESRNLLTEYLAEPAKQSRTTKIAKKPSASRKTSKRLVHV